MSIVAESLPRITQTSTVACDPMTGSDWAPSSVQQLEGSVGGLCHSLQSEQAKASLVCCCGHVVFFKDIGKGPIAVSLNEALCFHHGLYDDGCGVRLVVQGIAWIRRRRAPLRIVERLVAHFPSKFLEPSPAECLVCCAKAGFQCLLRLFRGRLSDSGEC